MDTNRLLIKLSTRILIQFVLAIVLVIVAIVVNLDFLSHFYLENQQTKTGIILNSFIVGLLIFGLLNLLWLLLRYQMEENQIAGFVDNVEAIREDPLQGLSPHSMIVKRYATMNSISQVHGEINHNALAAMLTADESTRLGVVRFINNILILTGVFGTIVALSIALIGASDLIDSAASGLGGMGLVIHGMSTALSTTITAIVSYVLFGYFYLRLKDVQTHLISGIEHLTSVYLIPKFVKRPEDLLSQMAGLIKGVIRATEKMSETQETYQASANTLHHSIETNRQQLDQLTADIADIKLLLREGFRLPPSTDNE
ncbi:MAG: hypothetical protein QNJ56_05115 [Gammaproteobacteria bacterium]|nr:hypothetical protein [Gammaproteobacteria bacterium]